MFFLREQQGRNEADEERNELSDLSADRGPLRYSCRRVESSLPLDRVDELLVGALSVDEEPGEKLAEQRSRNGERHDVHAVPRVHHPSHNSSRPKRTANNSAPLHLSHCSASRQPTIKMMAREGVSPREGYRRPDRFFFAVGAKIDKIDRPSVFGNGKLFFGFRASLMKNSERNKTGDGDGLPGAGWVAPSPTPSRERGSQRGMVVRARGQARA